MKQSRTIDFLYDWPHNLKWGSVQLLAAEVDKCPTIKYRPDDKYKAQALVDLLAYLTLLPLHLPNGPKDQDGELSDRFCDVIEDLEGNCGRLVYPNIGQLRLSIDPTLLEHSIPLSLYNLSLQQSDDFARCLILWKIIELSELSARVLIEESVKWKFAPVFFKKVKLENKPVVDEIGRRLEKRKVLTAGLRSEIIYVEQIIYPNCSDQILDRNHVKTVRLMLDLACRYYIESNSPIFKTLQREIPSEQLPS